MRGRLMVATAKGRENGRKWYHYILRENAFGSLAQMAVFFSGALITVVFPKVLGTEGFGYFAIVTSIAVAAISVADLGISSAILRFMGVGMRDGAARGYYLAFRNWKVVLTFFASAALFLSSDFLALQVYRAEILSPAFKLSSVLLFFYSASLFYDNYLISMKRNFYSLVLNAVLQASRLAFPLAFFVLFAHDVYGFIAGTAAAFALASVVGWLLAGRIELPEQRAQINLPAVRGFIFYSMIFLAVTNIINYSDVIILGMFLPAADVGVYRVAVLWAMAGALIMPFSLRSLSSIHAHERMEKSRRIFDWALRYAFAMAFLLGLGIFTVAQQFLALIYGAGFSAAYAPLLVLSVTLLDTVVSPLAGAVFVGKGRLGKLAPYSLAAALLQVALLFALVPAFGVLGAAAAVAAGRLASFAANIWLSLRLTGLRLDLAYIYKPAAAAAASALALYPFHGVSGWGGSILLGIGAVVAYAACMLLLGGLKVSEMRLLGGGILKSIRPRNAN